MKTRLMIAMLVVAVLSVAAVDRNPDGKAGEGFWYRSISFQKTSIKGYIEVLGEMQNKSAVDYKSTMFDLTLYDARNDVIAVGNITINNFKKNSTRPIQTMLKVDINKISGYKIDYSLGIED